MGAGRSWTRCCVHRDLHRSLLTRVFRRNRTRIRRRRTLPRLLKCDLRSSRRPLAFLDAAKRFSRHQPVFVPWPVQCHTRFFPGIHCPAVSVFSQPQPWHDGTASLCDRRRRADDTDRRPVDVAWPRRRRRVHGSRAAKRRAVVLAPDDAGDVASRQIADICDHVAPMRCTKIPDAGRESREAPAYAIDFSRLRSASWSTSFRAKRLSHQTAEPPIY